MNAEVAIARIYLTHMTQKRRKTFNVDEAQYALSRIDNIIDHDSFADQVEGDSSIARSEYYTLDRESATEIGDWCKEYLTDDAWSRLRNSIKSNRHILKNKVKTLKVHEKTRKKLSNFADIEGHTIDKLINKFIDCARKGIPYE